MARLRQYFDTDFSHAIRVHVKLGPVDGVSIDCLIFYDFAGYMAFFACYVPGEKHSLEFYIRIVEQLEYGRTQLECDGKVTLPSAAQFPGELRVENPLELYARFFGDPSWISIKQIVASRRIFIYSEGDLTEGDIVKLKEAATKIGHDVQFRSKGYVTGRERFEVPLAFICHDWRDKEEVAERLPSVCKA